MTTDLQKLGTQEQILTLLGVIAHGEERQGRCANADMLAHDIRILFKNNAALITQLEQAKGDAERDSFGSIMANFVTEKNIADLKRFDEVTQDGEGYDVSNDGMDALADIGLVRRTHARHFQFTDLGLFALAHFAVAARASQGEGKNV